MGQGRFSRRPFDGKPAFGRRSFDRPREDRPGPGGAGAGERRGAARFLANRPEGERFASPRFGAPRPGAGRPGGRRDDRPGPRFRPPGPGAPRFEDRRPSAPADRGNAPAAPGAAGTGESFAGAAPSELIWGRHSAQAVLESGRPVHRIWCTPEMRFSPRFLQLLREAKSGGVLVEEVTWARLGQISGGAVHQGIVLQPAAAETLDLPSLIDGCRGVGESPLLIAVDGLTDPQNLGAIVRSAEALGAHGMVLPQRRNAGLTGSVAKVAAGALEHLPVARVVNLNRSLDALKQEGYRVVGLAAEGTVSLEEADLSGPLVVVTGSEGEGLSMLTRRSCDQLVRIPLRGSTPSLNASVATALLLYEVARRSWMHGLRGTAPAPRLVRPALPTPEPAAAPPIPETLPAEGGGLAGAEGAAPVSHQDLSDPMGHQDSAAPLDGQHADEQPARQPSAPGFSAEPEPVATSPAREAVVAPAHSPIESPPSPWESPAPAADEPEVQASWPASGSEPTAGGSAGSLAAMAAPGPSGVAEETAIAPGDSPGADLQPAREAEPGPAGEPLPSEDPSLHWSAAVAETTSFEQDIRL